MLEERCSKLIIQLYELEKKLEMFKWTSLMIYRNSPKKESRRFLRDRFWRIRTYVLYLRKPLSYKTSICIFCICFWRALRWKRKVSHVKKLSFWKNLKYFFIDLNLGSYACLPFVSIHGKKCSRNLFKLARFIGTICFKVNLDQLTTQKHGSWEVKHTNPNNKFSHLQSIFTSSSIDNRRKEVSTKLWYSTMGRSAMHRLSPFSGIVRACAHALIFFTAVSKRDVVSHDV